MISKCDNCALRPVVAGGRCRACYDYRRRTGRERPAELDWRPAVARCQREREDELAERIDRAFVALTLRANRVRIKPAR